MLIAIVAMQGEYPYSHQQATRVFCVYSAVLLAMLAFVVPNATMQIAVVQTPGTSLTAWQGTLESIDRLVQQAATGGAELAVLPECVWPAYCLGSVDAYWQARESGLPPATEFVERMTTLARRHALSLCVGHVAERGQRLANAATLIDASGNVCGTYHKCFLWDFDNQLFDAGTDITPIPHPSGSIGVLVCADARMPEIAATLAARGANVLLQPTAWVNAATPPDRWNPQPDFLAAARSAEFGVPIASASKWGIEGETTFVGLSLICDAEGVVRAQCGTSETQMVVADVELTTPRTPELTDDERRALAGDTAVAHTNATVPPLELVLVGGETALLRTLGSEAGETKLTVARLRNSIGEVLEFSDVRIGVLAGEDVARFAAARRLGLAGVHIIAVVGVATPGVLLRARACENRVFVVGLDERGGCVIEPTGHVRAVLPWPRHGESFAPIVLNAALAADKEAAPGTNMITGRRPELYAL